MLIDPTSNDCEELIFPQVNTGDWQIVGHIMANVNRCISVNQLEI